MFILCIHCVTLFLWFSSHLLNGLLGPTFSPSGSVGLEWGPRICLLTHPQCWCCWPGGCKNYCVFSCLTHLQYAFTWELVERNLLLEFPSYTVKKVMNWIRHWRPSSQITERNMIFFFSFNWKRVMWSLSGQWKNALSKLIIYLKLLTTKVLTNTDITVEEISAYALYPRSF